MKARQQRAKIRQALRNEKLTKRKETREKVRKDPVVLMLRWFQEALSGFLEAEYADEIDSQPKKAEIDDAIDDDDDEEEERHNDVEILVPVGKKGIALTQAQLVSLTENFVLRNRDELERLSEERERRQALERKRRRSAPMTKSQRELALCQDLAKERALFESGPGLLVPDLTKRNNCVALLEWNGQRGAHQAVKTIRIKKQ
jgi:Translation machinery-associated protein 16